MRNSVTSQLRKAKKHYFNLFFEETQNNVKQTRKGIRILINVSKKSSTNIKNIVDNGKEITDPKEMADIINHFYVNIGRTIDKKYPIYINHFLIISLIEIFTTLYLTLVRKMK